MDLIITAVGEFIWTSSSTIVNFCLSSGLSALVVFVSLLCGILASAFYKYTSSRERMLFENSNDQPVTTILSTKRPCSRLPSPFIQTRNTNNGTNLLSEIEISCDQETNENNEQITNDTISSFSEDSEEEEIQTKQIQNIYHLLNDVNLTTADFLDQLKMYGLQIDDETELELS